jgi:hypothetical protein
MLSHRSNEAIMVGEIGVNIGTKHKVNMDIISH